MREPLRRTIVDEDAGEATAGWSYASPRSGCDQPGRNPTRSARKRNRRALRELLAARFGSPPELPDRTDSDSLELTIAA
jgi:hypothetical protein